MRCFNKSIRIITAFAGAILCLLFIVSCSEEKTENFEQIPPGVARISGFAYDAGGAPIAGVGIHAIYELEESAAFGSVRLPVDVDSLPVELTAQPNVTCGDRELTLSFNVASETDVTNYEIWRDGVKITELEKANGSYAYLDRNLVNGRLYCYTIVAVSLTERKELSYDGRTVWTGVPLFDCGLATQYMLYQNSPNPFEDSTRICFDLLEAVHTQLTLSTLEGQTIATLVSGVPDRGRHVVTLTDTALANGLYEYKFDAGDFFQWSRILLKNTGDYEALRNTSPGTTTVGNGAYSFDVSVGDSIEKRDEFFHDLGKAALKRVTLVALKDGYQPADTTLDLDEGAGYTINFTLWPE